MVLVERGKRAECHSRRGGDLEGHAHTQKFGACFKCAFGRARTVGESDARATRRKAMAVETIGGRRPLGRRFAARCPCAGVKRRGGRWALVPVTPVADHDLARERICVELVHLTSQPMLHETTKQAAERRNLHLHFHFHRQTPPLSLQIPSRLRTRNSLTSTFRLESSERFGQSTSVLACLRLA